MRVPERVIRYACGTCGREKPKAELLAKRVTFAELGSNKIARSRTVSWLCRTCREQDPAWTQPSFTSPGLAGTRRSPNG